ncbi:MAG: low molecular weight phosphatase family protein [Pseudomonadota bacterium]
MAGGAKPDGPEPAPAATGALARPVPTEPAKPLPLPGAILFCCNHNAIRSPLAEALMKSLHGRRVFVQSCGVREHDEVDPFMTVVAGEIGIDMARHRPRSFEQMEAWGDDITSYDVIVALSPAAQRQALERVQGSSVEVLYWPTLDPSGIGESREQKLAAYRQTRDQVAGHLATTFGS